MTLKQGLLIFGLGAVAGIAATCWGTNRQIAAVKQAAKDSTAAAVKRDSATTHYADSLLAQVDSLQKAKRPVTIKITKDSATAALADSAFRAAKTDSARVVILLTENAALKSEIVGLRANARTDCLSLFDAMATAKTLRDSLHAQTRTIVGLNEQIQQLNQHALPGWARTGFEVARTGLAVWKFGELTGVIKQ